MGIRKALSGVHGRVGVRRIGHEEPSHIGRSTGGQIMTGSAETFPVAHIITRNAYEHGAFEMGTLWHGIEYDFQAVVQLHREVSPAELPSNFSEEQKQGPLVTVAVQMNFLLVDEGIQHCFRDDTGGKSP